MGTVYTIEMQEPVRHTIGVYLSYSRAMRKLSATKSIILSPKQWGVSVGDRVYTITKFKAEA
jgi:hypothetical protein